MFASRGSAPLFNMFNYMPTGIDSVQVIWWSPIPTSVIYAQISSPNELFLQQNYPNPFNPNTTILFGISSKLFISLKVFDVLGREIATLVSKELSIGNHEVQWNAANIPSGMYFYRLQSGNRSETKKLVLLK